jgi:hypothetical protein
LDQIDDIANRFGANMLHQDDIETATFEDGQNLMKDSKKMNDSRFFEDLDPK